MLAEIITIGDEILIGQIVDTNSAWIAQELNQIGIRISQITSISDNRHHILEALEIAKKRSNIVFITGGLGPTKDDITKQTLCDFFDTKLVLNKDVLKMISDFFTKRGKPLTILNKDQALVPETCEVILNPNGTAPGIFFEKNGVYFISMPGVPYEMKWMVKEKVIPDLIKRLELPVISHFTIYTIGIGESFLAEKIENWEEKLKSAGLSLAYLPSPGMVKLRMSSYNLSKEEVKKLFAQFYFELTELIGDSIFGFTENNSFDLTIQKVISDLLIEKNATLSIAESCTGGYLSHLLTSIPGSSAFFRGTVIAYHNDHKKELLNVNQDIIENFGAVSKECVMAMAREVRQKFDSDFSISTSGIAGPSGGTEDKPVGTVWIAICCRKKCEAVKFQFGTDRLRNIEMTSRSALDLLRKKLTRD